MITLHILKLLEDNGFGTIDTDLFFEKLTLDKTGLYIASRGTALIRGSRRVQAFNIYARSDNDIDGIRKLADVQQFFEDSTEEHCTLPPVPPISEREYTNVTIEPISSIENVGLDANNRIIYVLTAQVIYNN
jgi:hypothetical protein